MTFRYWRRKLLLILLLFALIVVLYYNQKRFDKTTNRNNGISIQESHSLSNNVLFLSKLSTLESNLIDIEGGYDNEIIQRTQLKRCDVCLGNHFCQSFKNDLLVINNPYVRNGKVYREAVIKNTNEKITLMSPTIERWSNLEQIICTNASLQVPCDQSIAIQNSFMAKSDLLTIDNFRNFLHQIHATYNENDKQNIFLHATFSQCATNKYLQLMQTSFDDNNDKYMDLSEQSHLLSSLLAFPGYAVLKMVQKTESDLQFVNTKGVCGRLLAFEGQYQTLDQFIKDQKNFEVMAGLAVQLIQLIDDLQEEDPNWYFLKTSLTFDSILVNKDGELFLADLDDMVIIDKSLFDEQSLRSHPSLLNSEVCNDVCFEKFHQRFIRVSNANSSLPSPECRSVQKYYGQHMYAMICRNIFSSVESSVDSNISQKSRPGLLKLVPNKDKENVDDLLRECVYETSPGGRKQAIDELRDLLKSYLHFEDNGNEDNNGENNDKDNEDDEDNNIDENQINDNENSNVEKT